MMQASFGYDTCAVKFTHNTIIAALPCALVELQKRMTNPFRALSWSKACPHALEHASFARDCLARNPWIVILCDQQPICFHNYMVIQHCKRETEGMPLLHQESREAMECAKQFKAECRTILQFMRARGPPDQTDMSVGAQLLRVLNPGTGGLKAPCSA